MSLSSLYLEFSVWDYDRLSENNALGQVTVSVAGSFLFQKTMFNIHREAYAILSLVEYERRDMISRIPHSRMGYNA